MKVISSRDNPSFRMLRATAEDSREQQKSGRTVIDGPHLVAAYRSSVGLPLLLAVSEAGLALPEVQALLSQHRGVETLCLKETLFRDLSGVATPLGILALIEIPPPACNVIDGGCVLLDGIQDSGNVGSILRSAAAAGIRDAVLGAGCAGAWTPRVLRAGQGAHFQLRIRERTVLEEFVRNYRGRALATMAAEGRSLFEADLGGNIAWIFGSEGRGVNPELAALATERVTIPLAPHSESLNVGAAAAVCLFEALRQNLRP